MVEKRTLGEKKIGSCAWCEASFEMKRFDQKFCSNPCLRKGKRANKVPWADRPDREAMNAARSARYHANREQQLAKQRAWRAAHPEEARERDRQQYRKYRQQHIESTKRYRALHPEVRKTEYRNSRQKRPWKMALTNARHRSLKKSLAFDLTREWCERVWDGRCSISGLPFSFGTQTHFLLAPSIDRINSTKGYTQDNCRFVLFAVNSLKGVGDDEAMYLVAEAIVANKPKPLVTLESCPQKPIAMKA